MAGEGEDGAEKLLRTYIGVSFTAFLAMLPAGAASLVPALRRRNRGLYSRLLDAEEELRELRCRRKEDSKANARVVEIFAGHRHAWQQEEKRLLGEIDAMRERVAKMEEREGEMRERVEELRREVGEREEMLGFMAERETEAEEEREYFVEREGGKRDVEEEERETEADAEEREYFVEREELEGVRGGLFGSKFWGERPTGLWQDVQYESVEPLYHLKQFVSRREYPWKIDGETTGVSSKLKLLEQEFLNLERIGHNDLSKIPSQMKKQAKRYQALAGKIDDLCRRMQASDPYEATMSSEFKTQRHTEFLLEAVRLQNRATETAQKLTTLQTETGKTYYGNEVETTRRCLDLIKNSLKEIQRNLEIWLARIIGDLEGILARDGVSRFMKKVLRKFEQGKTVNKWNEMIN